MAKDISDHTLEHISTRSSDSMFEHIYVATYFLSEPSYQTLYMCCDVNQIIV